jgi:hypothetical protein
MNKTKILSISGTVLLTAMAVFVGRASTRFSSNATSLFVKVGSTCSGIDVTGGMVGTTHLTVGGTGALLSFHTGGSPGTNYPVYNTSTCQTANQVRANAF